MAPWRSPSIHTRQLEDPIRRFLKIILQLNIEEKKLRLPLKFARKYSSKLSDIAKLFVSDGRIWEVEVKREGEHIWFGRGFYGFAQHYCLIHGHLLSFKYKGSSNFSVHIFDKSSCEILYSSQNEAIGISESAPNPSTKSRQIPKKHPKTATSRKEKEVVCNYWSESGFPSPRHFKSENPHFEVQLKSYHYILNVVYVPTGFSRKHMAEAEGEHGSFKLEVCDGRQWTVSLKRKKSGRLSLGKGWKVFYEENNLKPTDVCVFELAKNRNKVFKVYIFVAL